MGTRAPVRRPPGEAVDPAPITDVPVEARLEELQIQFDRLRAQVRQAQQLATLGTAAATIAHEFSNLLTPIVNYCRAASESADVPFMQKALGVTLRNAEILTAMSERLLELNAAKPPKRERVPLRTVVADAVASLCRDLSKDGIQLTVRIDESLAAWADRLQLQQVLFNLLLNAREAMADAHGGRLTVSAERCEDRVVLEVRNNGAPVPSDLLPHVFQPLQSSKPVTSGRRQRCSGLGLALCRDLVEENLGTIDVSSDQEAGTAFRISLPVSAASADGD